MRFWLNKKVVAASAEDLLSPEGPWQLTMTTKLGSYAGFCAFSATSVSSEQEMPRSLSKQQIMSLTLLHEKHWEEMLSLLGDRRGNDSRGSENDDRA